MLFLGRPAVMVAAGIISDSAALAMAVLGGPAARGALASVMPVAVGTVLLLHACRYVMLHVIASIAQEHD